MKGFPNKIRHITILILFALFCSFLPFSSARAAGLCYVNDDAGGTNTGASWANAYTSLQSAIADSCTEIWVAAGTYKPHASDRAVSFALETGTAIYGGFAGTETLRTERNPTANLTTLSGDLLGNDSGFTNNDENSFHVVTGSGLTNTAVLDGFTIRGGNAYDFSTEYNGGGIHLSNSSPMLANLVITNNNALGFGGGMYTLHSSPTLTEVTFSGNFSVSYGGGMYSNFGSPTLSGVTFSANSVHYSGRGGGMYNDGSSPTLTNVTFSGNFSGDDVESAPGAGMFNENNSNVTITNATFSNNVTLAAQGGGIYNSQSTLTITNATFSGNSAIVGGGISKISGNATLTNVTFSGNAGAYYGGGIENQFSNSLILVNVTFSGNSAGTGGGLYNTGTATLTNTLLANNPGGDCVKSGGGNIAAASNNLIKNTGASACGLVNGSNGNIIGSDPNLGALTGSPAYFPLNTGSLAIDAGTNTGCPASSQNGLSRPQGGVCDIGSYELEATTPPLTVSSITRAFASPTSASSVDFTVTFSAPVQNVDVSDFSLTAAGITGSSVAGVAGSGASYTVSVNTGNGNGTLRLDINAGVDITGLSSEPITNLPYTSGEVYTIEKSNTSSFSDVPPDHWAYTFIERLYNSGITGGCSTVPLNYCPSSPVTRAQMAVFLLKGIHGSAYLPPDVGAETGFTDVDVNHWAAAWIKQLAAESITSGCGSGIYCPEDSVTRAQMAVFLLKAMHGSSFSPPDVEATYGDTAGHWAEDWIERLATEGITAGCGNGNYCPEDAVLRDQMAVFLVRAFHLP